MKRMISVVALTTAFVFIVCGQAFAIGLPIPQVAGTAISVLGTPINILLNLTGLDMPSVPTGTPVDLSGVLNLAGGVLNTADDLGALPLVDGLLDTIDGLGVLDLTDEVLDNVDLSGILEGNLLTKTGLVGSLNTVALIPMPLDPSKACEDCHHDRTALITAMVANNGKYPGLILDIPFVDNFYVDAGYTERSDSMMSKAKLHPAWDGCKTCHGSGDTFNPFPSDNWVPDSNPKKGPEAAWAWGTTNDVSDSCGKCHSDEAGAFNKGIMGTHRGHLAAFNYNDFEMEGVNVNSDFIFKLSGSEQAGTKDVAGGVGYTQSRESCSPCHQSCSDCHLTGPGNNPINVLATPSLLKGALLERINIDQTHTTLAPRVKVFAAPAVRRGGVFMLELRKGYEPGVSRGVPYSIVEAGMDITNHKFVKPTTAEQGNEMAPQTQEQSISFCWRCHFRSGSEYMGQFVSVVPNPNYTKDSLAHLQAGMTCTDCHGVAEVHGDTSADSASFFGTTDAPDNRSHPGGSPLGSIAAWPITPNPVRVTCELCHTKEGQALGPTGGEEFGKLVTTKYQDSAQIVKGLGNMSPTGAPSDMSHANVQCDVCHTQAQQNCWNCHIETAEELGALPGISSDSPLNLNLFPSIVNVREAEGEPHLSPEENALLQEAPARNDAYNIVILLTYPQSVNTVNKAPRFMGRNNQGQVASMVHCPGPPTGVNNDNNNPQPLNLDGGLYLTKSGTYGEEGATADLTSAQEGSWYMEAGHSIARTPDGEGYTACYNCHADTIRLGKEPITYYRKNPWVMKSTGVPEALMPDSHYLDNRFKRGGYLYCACHTETGIVHNGTENGPFLEH